MVAREAVLRYNKEMSHLDTQTLAGLDGEALLTELQKIAVTDKISDIHINPKKEGADIEWREKGILTPVLSVSHDVYVTMQRRIKFQAKLKLNIITAPQDGQYVFPHEKRFINVRVASLPTRFGEAFTLRFLDPQRGIVPLPALGFPKEIETQLNDLAHLPNGIILVTGPTGSGKTTTLYALLSMIAGKERNIITLEDPIEYELSGIIQSQIDPDHDYTFASGLRSVLRHDPDIILVGEIRDYETAQTAIDASLTGHLVFATLHTNSAVEAIPRLLSMGVSPYTFAPALRAILAQRLIRTLKDENKGKNVDPSDQSVYGGQMALPELLIATVGIREQILTQAPEREIVEAAKKEGYKTMLEWGDEIVKAGTTCREEILRVTA